MHRVLKEIAISFGIRPLLLEILFAFVFIFFKSEGLIVVGKNVCKLFFQKEGLPSEFA